MNDPQDYHHEPIGPNTIEPVVETKPPKVSGDKTHGGQHVDSDKFLQKLTQLYGSSKSWGTVRLQIKRSFPENYKYKKSQKKLRQFDREASSKDPNQEFSLVIKAASKNRKIATVVPPRDVYNFEKQLTQVISQALFRSVLERQEKAKKQQKKDKKKDTAPVAEKKGKGTGKKDAPGRIKKCRNERRKEIRKASRKQNRAKDKEEKSKLKQSEA